MAQDHSPIDDDILLADLEANTEYQSVRAEYEVRLIETLHAVEREGWEWIEPRVYAISHSAQLRIVDVLIEMVVALFEAAAKAGFGDVGSPRHKERVDGVKRLILSYALDRWASMTSGLPLVNVEYDPKTKTGRTNEELLSATLTAHIHSKALDIELEAWQSKRPAESDDLATVEFPVADPSRHQPKCP